MLVIEIADIWDSPNLEIFKADMAMPWKVITVTEIYYLEELLVKILLWRRKYQNSMVIILSLGKAIIRMLKTIIFGKKPE